MPVVWVKFWGNDFILDIITTKNTEFTEDLAVNFSEIFAYFVVLSMHLNFSGYIL